MTILKGGQRAAIERALDAADARYRLYLLHGPDGSGSRALAARLAKAMGADAERVDLTGPQLKADPARLADEAASISLFGGKRHIRVEPAGDEAIEALEALLDAAVAGNPVVAIAGALRKDGKLLKLAARPDVLAFASYAPEGAAADGVAAEIGKSLGLRMRPEVAHRLVVATGADRALLARELEKLALYVDATTEASRELEHEAIDAVGADAGDADLDRLVNATLEGRAVEANAELARLAGEGVEGIPVARAVQRQLLLLAEVRSDDSPESAVQRLTRGRPPKLGDALRRQSARWDGPALANALVRIAEAGRASMGPTGPLAIEMELGALARAAARRR